MAKQFSRIEPAHRDFVARQRIFFAASAAEGARINMSPRGADALRLLGDNAVCYLDETGSGNETAAHLLADGRLTLMFCAFEGAPMILRFYGRGRVLTRGSAAYAALLQSAFDGRETPGARQIVHQEIDLVVTSCGFGVPLFDYVDDRPTLRRWAESKGEAGLAEYRAEKNVTSLDGLPTGMPTEVQTEQTIT
jgi:hypothetical protein